MTISNSPNCERAQTLNISFSFGPNQRKAEASTTPLQLMLPLAHWRPISDSATIGFGRYFRGYTVIRVPRMADDRGFVCLRLETCGPPLVAFPAWSMRVSARSPIQFAPSRGPRKRFQALDELFRPRGAEIQVPIAYRFGKAARAPCWELLPSMWNRKT